MTNKTRKPLAGVRRKLVRAIKATKGVGGTIAHTWGNLVKPAEWDYESADVKSPARYYRVDEYKGQTCPMGAAILVYDDVDGLDLDAAAAKILGTKSNNIGAFLTGYDNLGDRNLHTGTQRRWFDLGVSMRKYADA